jgi:UDP-N-acetylglucosamine 3-dehydrogenase
MKKLCVGLVGLGYWGANYFRVLRQFKEVDLKYACDKETSKLMNYAELTDTRSINFTDDPTKIAKDKEVEAVIIATPASSHHEIAKMMLEAGKHVLVEKPLTMNYKQAIELCDLSERMNRILMVGHIYCFNPAVKYIKDVIRSGMLGDLYYGIGLRLGLGPIRHDASCTWDLATHDIAMLIYLMDVVPRHVSAEGLSFLQKERRIHDYANIRLKFESGFQFNLVVSWYAAEKIRIWYLMGSKRMLKFDDMNKNTPVTIYNKSVTVLPTDQDAIHEVGRIIPTEGDTIVPYIHQTEPLLLECRHFIESVKTGRKPLTDGVQGANVVKVLEAVEESINDAGLPKEVKHDFK